MLKDAVVAGSPACVTVTVNPVLSLALLLFVPNPTVKSTLSPAFRVRTSENGTPLVPDPVPFTFPLSRVVEEFRSTATSVVVLVTAKNLPWIKYDPAAGVVQRTTLFSPPTPGCISSVFGGTIAP